MDVQARILQALRPRSDGVVLRSDLSSLGSASQVSAALAELCRKGSISRIERGVYALPTKLASQGKQALLQSARKRQADARQATSTREKLKAQRITAVSRHVMALAKRVGVSYVPTFSDRWVASVTKLAGDDIASDSTDDLLVALARAGKLSPLDMTKMVMAHHRALKAHV